MNTRTKECFYDVYCETCKYKNTEETDDPCNECLTFGYNIDSHKPRRYEEA